jgi:hypothetical protein
MPTSLDLSRTYTSFSGVDIRAVINGESVGQLQAVSYAVQREKAPIYVMGKVDPLSFSRGKRGIAGTLISLLLDHHMLHDAALSSITQPILDKDELYPDTAGSIVDATVNDIDVLDPSAIGPTDVADYYKQAPAFYVDQLLPFDIVIVAANEYGKAAQMRIYGVEILNEGSGFSIDDIVIENQMTYVCRTILPWRQMGSWSATGTFTAQPMNTPFTAP